MLFVGGVSLNGAVTKHIENLTEIKPVVGENSNLYGAIGAACCAEEEMGFQLTNDNAQRCARLVLENRAA